MLSKEEIVDTHCLPSFDLSLKAGDYDLLLLYWIPKVHKCSYKQRYIARADKCSAKFLSRFLTSILPEIS